MLHKFYALITPYIWVLLATCSITIVSKIILSIFDVTNILLLYLLPVLIAAVHWGLYPSIFASALGVLSFDFFFIPPFLSFSVADLRYLLSFFVFLLVALITGTMATRLKNQAEAAGQRERRTTALYALSKKFVAETEIGKVLDIVVKTISKTMDGDVFIFLADMTGNLTNQRPAAQSLLGTRQLMTATEQLIINQVYKSGQLTWNPNDQPENFQALFIPIRTEIKTLGVLYLKFKIRSNLTTDQKQLLEAIANLTAIAILRLQLAEEARKVQYLTESERLRTTLFNSLSHDIRTPLASITGAVTGLLDEGEIYDLEAQHSLLQTIKDGAVRLNRIVSNLLDMARIESGMMKLNREWCDLQDIIGVVLRQIQDAIPERQFKTFIPADLPLIRVDFSLIEQVMINLLENAAKYSAIDQEISISIYHRKTELQVIVADYGSGIPEADRERIFDKFYRLYSPHDVSGAGLGLSICKEIIEAHQGRIWVEPHTGGGSEFIFNLPLDASQPSRIPACTRASVKEGLNHVR